jgi:hypothetical protein
VHRTLVHQVSSYWIVNTNFTTNMFDPDVIHLGRSGTELQVMCLADLVLSYRMTQNSAAA